MIHKLFRPCTIVDGPAEATLPPPKPLRIIHAGGGVDCYYMAVTAALIMEKYPQGVLARPDVFRRPWKSLVHPDEILKPGQKFFVVPRSTIRKLRSKAASCNRLQPKLEITSGKSDNESVIKSTEVSGETLEGKRDMGVTARSPVAPMHPSGWRWRPRKVDTWQPSLRAIDEASPPTSPTLASASKVIQLTTIDELKLSDLITITSLVVS